MHDGAVCRSECPAALPITRALAERHSPAFMSPRNCDDQARVKVEREQQVSRPTPAQGGLHGCIGAAPRTEPASKGPALQPGNRLVFCAFYACRYDRASEMAAADHRGP